MSFKPGDLVVLIPLYSQGAWLWEHNTNGSHLTQTKWEPGDVGLFIGEIFPDIGENDPDRFITYVILIGDKLCKFTIGIGKSMYVQEPIFEKYVEPKE